MKTIHISNREAVPEFSEDEEEVEQQLSAEGLTLDWATKSIMRRWVELGKIRVPNSIIVSSEKYMNDFNAYERL